MKTVEEIYETLKADMAQRAGFVPEDGCDLAVRLWAAAAQIQALEIQADWVLAAGIQGRGCAALLCGVCPGRGAPGSGGNRVYVR